MIVELQGLAMSLARAGHAEEALETDRIAAAFAEHFNAHPRVAFWDALLEENIGLARAAAPGYVASHPLEDLGAARDWALSLADELGASALRAAPPADSSCQDRRSTRGGSMFKVVWFARFPKGMTPQDARRYWKRASRPRRARRRRSRATSKITSAGPVPAVSGVPEEETYFDGYSCGWWSDRAAFDATMASPEWKALEADGDNVFDMSWLRGMSAALREHTVIDGPSSPFKVLWMVRFKAGSIRRRATATGSRSTGRSSRRWRSTATCKTTSAGRSTTATLPASTASRSAGFATRRSSCARSSRDAWAEAVADGDNFIDFSQLWGAVVEETVFRPVPAAGVAV